MSTRQEFADALAMPVVATYADPELTPGRTGTTVHDASWVVELAIDRRPISCILDGTRQVAERDAARLELLGQLLPPVAPLAALPAPNRGSPAGSAGRGAEPWNDEIVPEAPVWMRAWHGERAVVVPSDHDVDTLARLCVSCGLAEDPSPQAVLVVAAAASSLVSRVSLAALRAHLPNVRPLVLSIEPLRADVLAGLAESGGGYLLVERRDVQSAPAIWRGVTMEIDRARDVELAVNALDVERFGDTWRAPCASLPIPSGITEVHVHGITAHVDARVFAVHARGRRLDLPLAFGVLHDAHRSSARALRVRES